MEKRERREESPPQPPSGCRACGACCEHYGGVLAATAADLDRWRTQGRCDLLSRVGADGTIWLDPVSGEHLLRCPFLDRLDPRAAHCTIHDTKPAICRAYPTEVHGFRCLRGVQFPLSPWWSADRVILA